MRLTFVNGFPDNISVSLQQVTSIMTMFMYDVISRARVSSSKISEQDVTAASL